VLLAEAVLARQRLQAARAALNDLETSR